MNKFKVYEGKYGEIIVGYEISHEEFNKGLVYVDPVSGDKKYLMK